MGDSDQSDLHSDSITRDSRRRSADQVTRMRDITRFEDMNFLMQIIALFFMSSLEDSNLDDNDVLSGMAGDIIGYTGWRDDLGSWRENMDFSNFDFQRAQDVTRSSPLISLPFLESSDINPDFYEAFRFVLGIEGDFNPDEPHGGVARYGINSSAHPDIDVTTLTVEAAMEIYHEQYWTPMVNFAQNQDPPIELDHAQMLVVFDAAVNHGPGFARRMLRETDGDIEDMFAFRETEYERLVRENPAEYGRYEGGWANRLTELRAEIEQDAHMHHLMSFTGEISIGPPVELKDPNDPQDAGYRVSDTFRMRDVHPVTGRASPHRGIDVATPRGVELAATADAQVAYAGHSNGYGNIVVLHHGAGIYTMYAHLDDIDVRTGDMVMAGQSFAETGNTGRGTGAHLHYEVWIQRGGQAHTVNPQSAWGRDLTDPSVQQELIREGQQLLRGADATSAAFRARVPQSISAGAQSTRLVAASEDVNRQFATAATTAPESESTRDPALDPSASA